MKRTVKTVILTGLLLGLMVVPGRSADMEHQHPGDEAAMPSNEMHEMMMKRMEMMQDKEGVDGKDMMGDRPCMVDGAPCSKPCMMAGTPPARHHMHGERMSGMMGMNPAMMHQRMDHELFLDRVDALGLNPDQVTRLKAIRADCRKQNIRTAAEAQIARLELKDLLDEESWSLKDAEPLVRQVQTLEGDMLVRHLQAVAEARMVLTAEQRQQAAGDADKEDLEELFR